MTTDHCSYTPIEIHVSTRAESERLDSRPLPAAGGKTAGLCVNTPVDLYCNWNTAVQTVAVDL